MAIEPMDTASPINIYGAPDGAEPTSALIDEFLKRMQTIADMPCIVGGFFGADRAALLECRAVVAPQTTAGLAADLARWLSSRLAIFQKLHEGSDEGDLYRGESPEHFPIWIRDGSRLLGIGRSTRRRYPVVACVGPGLDARSELKDLLGLALVFLAHAAERMEDAPTLRAEDAAFATMKRLSIGCFIVNGQGKVLYDGRPAGPTSAGPWVVHHGQLSVCEEQDRLPLRKALEEATQTKPRSSIISLTNAEGQKADMVVVTPLSRPGSGPLALVLFDTRRTDHHALRTQFFRAHDLTRSESLVAHQVLDGRTLNEMTEATGLSLATVRSYLKQVMAKTGTHRRVSWWRSITPASSRWMPRRLDRRHR